MENNELYHNMLIFLEGPVLVNLYRESWIRAWKLQAGEFDRIRARLLQESGPPRLKLPIPSLESRVLTYRHSQQLFYWWLKVQDGGLTLTLHTLWASACYKDPGRGKKIQKLERIHFPYTRNIHFILKSGQRSLFRHN